MISLNKVCRAGNDPIYTPYGYIIGPDGTIYSLTQKYCHGVVLALLLPDLAKEHGYESPEEDFDVYEYQRFELDHARDTKYIRVALSLFGQFNLSKNKDIPATPEQVVAVSKVLKVAGLRLNDTVQTDLQETTARDMMNNLQSGEI